MDERTTGGESMMNYAGVVDSAIVNTLNEAAKLPNTLDRFRLLDSMKRELAEAAKRINRAWEQANEALMNTWEDAGISNAQVEYPDGEKRTIYTHHQLWGGAIQDESGIPDWDRTCRALKAAGLGAMVQPRFNAQTLSAWLREQPRNDEGNPILPPELEGNIRVYWDVELRSRKAPE